MILGQKVKLVQLSLEHFDPYLEYVNDPIVSQTTEPYEEFEEYNPDELRNWLSLLSEKKNRADFAILRIHDDLFVGEVVLNEIQDGKSNIRIGLGSRFFDQGYGTEAMRLAIQYAFSNLDINEITLSVFKNNPRGIKVYKKIGFEITGEGEEQGHPEIYMSIKKPLD
tara:strand:- start:517 stop:1017 length:501 start_codon:yes stop_codon:yes gene_type:complete